MVSEATWSKLIPTWPLRTARPSEIIRPVSVTIPAPMITPKIPSNGLFESSAGTACASPRAICCGVNCATAAEAPIARSPLTPCAHGGDDGEPRTQGSGNARIIEPDLYGDSLHDFREITGGIVSRQQRELRTPAGPHLDHLSLDPPSLA